MNEDPFWQQAEYLITRGYAPTGTDVGKLSIQLREAEEKTNKDKVQNTRASVYGELAPKIDEFMDEMGPGEKRLVEPHEAVVSKRDLNSL